MQSDSNFLKENNARHMWHPMAHPAEMLATPPKIITGAAGVTLTDVDGHRVVDAVGGLWNVNLGYSCDPVKKAITDQLQQLAYYSSFRGTAVGPAIELSHMLAEWFAPEGMVRSFFTSGGSDSVESALRLARQYHKIRRQSDRVKFLSLKKGYHGTHFGGASVNGNANFRRNYEPLLPGCFQIASPYTYRNPFNESDPAKLAQLCIQDLEDEIAFQGGDTIAAFIMEPVLGAGGVIPPHASFMPKVREICDRHGILLIADEVITAFGRTGAWTGSRLWGVKPDMMCLAKAITNGYFPFGGVLINGKIAEVFEADRTTLRQHRPRLHLFGASCWRCCRTRLHPGDDPARRRRANAAARGDELHGRCRTPEGKARVRWRRPRQGADGRPRTAYPIEPKKHRPPRIRCRRYSRPTYANGVMIRISGPTIILSPPLVITPAHVDEIIGAIDAGLTSAR